MKKAARFAISLAGLSVALLAASCTRTAAAKSRLVLTGSSTIAPLAAELGKEFERQHPGVRVEVQAGGSSRGVADARAGAVDLGMASRALKPDEQDLTATLIAWDGIALIVHASNPVGELTEEQVRAIWRGESRDWGAFGRPAAPIIVVNKAAGRSTLELFLDHFALKAAEVKADVVIGDNAQGIKTVAGNEHAIGYVSIGSAEAELAAGTPIRMLPLRGVAPTTANVRNGTFPLRRPLHLVSKGPPTGVAQEFCAFARSAAARPLIEGLFFVPLNG